MNPRVIQSVDFSLTYVIVSIGKPTKKLKNYLNKKVFFNCTNS